MAQHECDTSDHNADSDTDEEVDQINFNYTIK